jgi:hypothetical protein
MNLVTLERAREHLRSDETYDDAYVMALIAAASSAVLKYVGDTFNDTDGVIPLDSDGFPDVPEDVRIACLLLIGDFYKNREGKQEDSIGGVLGIPSGYGYLSRAVVALLFPYRTPTLA